MEGIMMDVIDVIGVEAIQETVEVWEKEEKRVSQGHNETEQAKNLKGSSAGKQSREWQAPPVQQTRS